MTTCTIGTLRQYAAAMRDEYFALTPDIGISKAEYDRIYPAESRRSEWLEDISAAARAGQLIPARLLDALYREGEHGTAVTLLRHHGSQVPAGYLPPHVRQHNESMDQARRAARRQGRLNAEVQR